MRYALECSVGDREGNPLEVFVVVVVVVLFVCLFLRHMYSEHYFDYLQR